MYENRTPKGHVTGADRSHLSRNPPPTSPSVGWTLPWILDRPDARRTSATVTVTRVALRIDGRRSARRRLRYPRTITESGTSHRDVMERGIEYIIDYIRGPRITVNRHSRTQCCGRPAARTVICNRRLTKRSHRIARRDRDLRRGSRIKGRHREWQRQIWMRASSSFRICRLTWPTCTTPGGVCVSLSFDPVDGNICF